MKDFLKMTGAVILGFIVVNTIFLVFSFMMLGALASLGTPTVQMPHKAVLVIDLSKVSIREQSGEPDALQILQGTSRRQLGLYDAVRAINTAATDPAVDFIYLRPDNPDCSLSSLEELRVALKNFRNYGKPVVTLTDMPGNGSYYLASASDKIYMYDYAGSMNLLTGVSTQMTFLKDILDKLGVNVQLIRHGKYKAAGETYIKNSISPENRYQTEAMVKSLWSAITDKVAEDRGISSDEFNSLIDNLSLQTPEDFIRYGLVDELVDKEEMKEKLAMLSGLDNYKKVKGISLEDYASIKVLPNLRAKNKIAIIYAEGNIIDGYEQEQVAGDRFASIIAKVREDSDIKAVVLRVNSPGGSVSGSDKIKKELDLLKKEKPLVASYGSYAASGGYWISNNCDYIFTNATTLTGSIGVFSLIPDFSKTMKDIAHVNITSISSNKHGDMYSGMRPLSASELQYMQASVEDIYDRFTGNVAESRGMTKAGVDSIAQGRVWTGKDALSIGLVDNIGTLEDAVNYAIDAASETVAGNFQVVAYPKPLSTMEKLMGTLGGNEASVLAGTPFEYIEQAFKNWKSNMNGKVYARMPYEYEIK